MTPEQLSGAVVEVLTALVDDGDVVLPGGAPTEAKVERPKVAEHGDYATNIALQLGKRAGVNPRELAGLIVDRLVKVEGIGTAEVAGPGFINVRVDPTSQASLAPAIVAAGDAYGTNAAHIGERVNLEFISANPTGPITVAHTRWAAVGDSLARLLSAVGSEVTREYYFNDAGVQVDRFARSLLARARSREVQEDGYLGSYVDEVAQRVVVLHPEIRELPDHQALKVLHREGVELMFAEIKASLHEFRVDFDVFFHENSLHASGAAARAVERLRRLGVMYEAEGALWLRTTDFGDDKDRVVIKSDGSPAYISADLAYYLDKRERGFDRCMILLGADHHGYVGRMMAMCAAFGDVPGDNLELIIGQMVNLLRDGQPLRVSKRAGTVVTIEDLVEAIGVDAARYALVRYSMDATIEIDLDLWAQQTSDNPVYYVQYAHARMASILRNAGDLGLAPSVEGFQPEQLHSPREGDLLRALADFPGVVAQAAELREPHRVARYLEDTASSFHRFYDECRVLPLGDEEPSALHRARVLLIAAARQVLANGLGLLGVRAPERM